MYVKLFLLVSIAAALIGCGPQEPMDAVKGQVRFLTLNASGSPAGAAEVHACVLDQATGLMWERKSDQPGLRDWRNTYSWFNPNQAHHELDYRGLANAGSCAASECDTWNLRIAANLVAYCGYSDWRLPTKDELFSISDVRLADSPPTTDTRFFPFTQSDEYWTANDYSFQPGSAWAWSFRHGHDRVDWKRSPKFVRLVRGRGEALAAVKE